MRRVSILQSRLVHYRVPLFERMRMLAREANIDLHVVYGQASERERSRADSGQLDWGEPARNILWPVASRELIWQVLPRDVSRSDLIVVGQHNRELLNYWLLLRRRFGGPLVGYWGHGRNFQSDRPDNLAERFKARVSRLSDWWFAYNTLSAEVVQDFGYPAAKVTSLMNSSDTRAFERDLASFSESELTGLRGQLGLHAAHLVGLYCGSLGSDKRLEFLIAATDRIHREIPAFRMVVVGNGPYADYLKRAADARPWLHWVGERHGREKAGYYRIAHLLLNPGSIGLSVLDAMSAGLPMFTTKGARHGPEISYLTHERTGFVLSGDADHYADTVIRTIATPGLTERIGAEARIAAQSYSIEDMADRFVGGIDACLHYYQRGREPHRTPPGISRPTAATQETHPMVPNPSQALSLHAAFLTNFIPPYRRDYFARLSDAVARLDILLSTRMESNRAWQADWGNLNVGLQRCLSFRFLRRHPDGYLEPWFLHLPWDTLPRLRSLRPDVTVSAELGARTLQAALFRIVHPRSRLIIYADLCERTEVGRSKAVTWFRRLLLRAADAVIVNGASGRRYIEAMGVPAERIARVPYATDTAHFGQPRADAPAHGPLRLIHVGQLIERKGLMPFIQALDAWARAHPDRPVELVLVGDGPLRGALAMLQTSPSLAVRLQGGVPYEELPSVYAKADVMVLPTLADTWALVVNEAMACGLPILGSLQSQAVEELVKDGETGWTFRPEAVDDMARAIDRALSTPRPEMRTMGVRARDLALQLTPESVAHMTAAVMSACMRGPAVAAPARVF
jgi:L-malate glycosyltransferase